MASVDPESTAELQHLDTDTEDSDFEDALEELVTASGIQESGEGKSRTKNSTGQDQGRESNVGQNLNNEELGQGGKVGQSSTCVNSEKRVAEEIVNDFIETATQKMTSYCDVSVDNDETSSTSETDSRQKETLYQNIEEGGGEGGSEEKVVQEEKSPENLENPIECRKIEDDHENFGDENDAADDSEDEEENEKFVIDEDFLKEREANLTDEQKQELKEQAQTLKSEGNELFKEHNFAAAVVSYTEALRTCPLSCAKERSIMYSNRGACKLHMDQKDSAIEDCSKALELNPNYMKCLLRRAELYEKTDKLDEALGDYQKALEMDPGIHVAREACLRLPEQIKERNEKLKEEMMGKLKDLGNLVLRPFGLSTDNFKLNQDPATGGYSVAFQQNAPNS